jgi:hypothetical protein
MHGHMNVKKGHPHGARLIHFSNKVNKMPRNSIHATRYVQFDIW